MQKLSKHLIGGVPVSVFCLKPDLISLDIDSSLLSFLEIESFDIDIFDVFFARCFLEFFVEGHVEIW